MENKGKKEDKITVLKNVVDKVLGFLNDNKEGIKKHPKLYIGAGIVFAIVVGFVTYMN